MLKFINSYFEIYLNFKLLGHKDRDLLVLMKAENFYCEVMLNPYLQNSYNLIYKNSESLKNK